MKLAHKIIEEYYNQTDTTVTGEQVLLEEQVSFVEDVIVRNAKKGLLSTRILSESIAPSTINYFENQGFVVSVSDYVVEFELPLMNL